MPFYVLELKQVKSATYLKNKKKQTIVGFKNDHADVCQYAAPAVGASPYIESVAVKADDIVKARAKALKLYQKKG
jgi:hypothetical protein